MINQDWTIRTKWSQKKERKYKISQVTIKEEQSKDYIT